VVAGEKVEDSIDKPAMAIRGVAPPPVAVGLSVLLHETTKTTIIQKTN